MTNSAPDCRDDELEPTIGDVFGVLAAEQRRLIIQYLHDETTGVAHVDDIADYVASHHSEPVRLEEVRLTLHHRDLPKLAAVGLLERDTRHNTVRYYESCLVERVMRLLDKPRENPS